MFSRTFYDATDINEFPVSMRECLQKDSKNRFYEDYYRVAVQNERYDDWSRALINLRKLFSLYEKEVIHHHERKGVKVPKATNSTASQGNFLEVLNMSLNGMVGYLIFNLTSLNLLQFLSVIIWIEALTELASCRWSYHQE